LAKKKISVFAEQVLSKEESVGKGLGEIDKRGQAYTEFLKALVADYRESAKTKRENRKCFLILTEICSIALTAAFIGMIVYSIINSRPLEILVTLIVGVLAEFIAIPLVIAKYLFNPEEDANIHNQLEAMQKHDTEVRSLLLRDDSHKD
jgi:F0F1-type ATP synthase assembly protein I